MRPELFYNEYLGGCDPLATILFVGLWCVADREGRFEWRMQKLRAKIFPYRDVDMSSLMQLLADGKLIAQYQHGESAFGVILMFKKYQSINRNEASSSIPPPPPDINAYACTCDDMHDGSRALLEVEVEVEVEVGSGNRSNLVVDSVFGEDENIRKLLLLAHESTTASERGNALSYHLAVERFFIARGFSTQRELPVKLTDGRNGRIDLLVWNESVKFALELDFVTPRGKSLLKLAEINFPGFVMTRTQGNIYTPNLLGKHAQYKWPDTRGNERKPHPKFPKIWLSELEISSLEKRFDKVGLRKEFWEQCYANVEQWFTDTAKGRKEYSKSSNHMRRVANWGLTAALKLQRESDYAKQATARMR